VPARRQITIDDLLTHTSGLVYGAFDRSPVGEMYKKSGVCDAFCGPSTTLAGNIDLLARQPLKFQPGTAYEYSLSIDVLGRVLEKVTRQDLATAVRTLVTAPLAMTDTAFVAAHADRLATPYADGKPRPIRMTATYKNPFAASTVDFSPARATDPRAFPSGGAGMVGTADDYLRFLEAIRTGGAPLLARATGATLGANATGTLETLRGPGWGWGMIGAVLVDPRAAGSPSKAGTIEWGGAYGATWWIDPAAGLSVILLTNTSFEGMSGKLPSELKAAIYGALE
jgi:CubicO group peptidase (beta-lactamase class C family)